MTMILKGSQRGGAKQLANHLLKVVENEHVEVYEVRGFMSDDLHGALKEIYKEYGNMSLKNWGLNFWTAFFVAPLIAFGIIAIVTLPDITLENAQQTVFAILLSFEHGFLWEQKLEKRMGVASRQDGETTV
jgi:hypothetical protein